MSLETPIQSVGKAAYWGGWAMSVLPSLLLFFSAGMKISQSAAVVEGFPKMGYPANLALGIGIVELACTILYLIPQTSVLGCILLTGYLGGATATHLRIEEPYYAPVIIGVILWGGLFLRDPKIRALIPIKR